MDSEISNFYTPQADSPRYVRYETRLRDLKALLDAAWRHRLTIAILTVAAIGLLLTLLSCIGTFIGPLNCPDYTYGEVPPAHVRAFWADIQYEFSPADSDAVWTGQPPATLGPYQIRAISHNGFGTPRYSNSVEVLILARDLQVTIADTHFVYGNVPQDALESHTTLTGLAPGDRVAAMEYDFRQTETGHYAVSLKELRIVDTYGRDVTGCYRITANDATMIMDPRPIDVTVQSVEKTYDGLPWDHTTGTASISGGSLAPGDTLNVTFEPQGTDAGNYPLDPLCQILNAAGEDVTHFYTITPHLGMLNIRMRRIHITTGSAEKLYDGEALTNSDWQLTKGTLLEGHELLVTFKGAQTAAGASKNTVSLQVFASDGTDMTSNYIFIVTNGTLKVNPIRLIFETGSAEKVFNGTALRKNQWQHLEGTVLPGHTFKAEINEGKIYAGTYQNTLRVTVFDSEGQDVTLAGYEIVVNCGTLTIKPRPLTIASHSAEKLYDGEALTCHDFSFTEGSLGTVRDAVPAFNPFFTGAQTEVGHSPNFFTVHIYDPRYKTDITYCYDITYEYGTLTVLDNPDYTEPPGDTDNPNDSDDPSGSHDPTDGKDPNDYHHTDSVTIDYPSGPFMVYAHVTALKGFSASTPIYFRDTSYGNYNGKGWGGGVPGPSGYNGQKNLALVYLGRSLFYSEGKSTAKLTIDRLSHCPALLPYYSVSYNPILGDANDCFIDNGLASYTLELYHGYSYEDLLGRTVSKYDVNQEKPYRDLVYQRYLQIPESTKTALLQWAKENGIDASSTTLVQDIQSAVMNACVYVSNGEPYPEDVDVVIHFLTEAKEGNCQHFASAATLLYRVFGIPARYTGGFLGIVQNGTTIELTTKNAHAWVEIYVDGLGWVPIEATPGGFSDNPGLDSMIKPTLVLKAFSSEKIYDGKPFAESELTKYYLLSGQLMEGHRLEVTVSYSKNATKPGVYRNRIVSYKVYDENGKDVTTEYYNVRCVEGTVTIQKRPITITLGSATRIYDGRPLQCTDYWVSAGSLLPGHVLRLTISDSVTDPGTKEIYPDKVEIFDYSGSTVKLVSDFYEWTIIPAELTILPPE